MAARGGVVKVRRYDPVLYGNLVIVRGLRERRDYWYAHLGSPGRARAGARVRTGQVLGGVGATGNARSVGCHLHFEMRGPARPVRPAPAAGHVGSLELMRRPGPARRLYAGIRIAVRTRLERRVPFRSPEALERRQRRAVRAAMDHALEHVPYYRETARRLGLSAGDLRCAADLARLPVIEREQVQEDPEYFVSEAVDPEEAVEVGSGGTTGQPVMVKRDRAGLLRAPFPGARPVQVMAHIAGTRRLRTLMIVPPAELRGDPGTRHRGVGRVLQRGPDEHPQALPVRTSGDPRGGDRRVQAPRRLRVRLLSRAPARDVGGGAAAEPSAGGPHLRRRRPVGHRPRDAHAMGIHVLSLYQSVEAGAIGFECERHRGHHVNSDTCPVRIVDPEGRDVADGESGEVLISNLANRATVLINYRQGDIARRIEPCDCGRALPMISRLEGRTAEWLTLPDGTTMHPQSVRMLLRMERSIRRYQVVQEQPDRFLLSLVTPPDADRPGMASRLERKFADQFGAGTTTRVEFVDDLPRTPAGKVRPVVAWSP